MAKPTVATASRAKAPIVRSGALTCRTFWISAYQVSGEGYRNAGKEGQQERLVNRMPQISHLVRRDCTGKQGPQGAYKQWGGNQTDCENKRPQANPGEGQDFAPETEGHDTGKNQHDDQGYRDDPGCRVANKPQAQDAKVDGIWVFWVLQ